MIIKINGYRLYELYLEQIRKEEDEENMEEEEIEISKRTLKMVFNGANLYNLKRREIADVNKKKLEINKNYKEKIDKNKTKKNCPMKLKKKLMKLL